MLLETKYFEAEYKEGIINVQYKPNLHLKLADAEQIVSERLKYFDGIQAPVLIKGSQIKSIDKAARSYLFDPAKGMKNINAMGIVCCSLLDRMQSTFIFYHNKPPVPHKMFNNEQHAIHWLKKYM